MKKNIFSILILALVIVNLVLTAIMMFSIVPASKKTNALVTKICSVLDLELEANVAETGEENIPIDQIATYDIADKITVNLKKDVDGEEHYAVFSVTLSMDKKNDGYKSYGEKIADKESLIKSEIIDVVSGFTLEEAQSNRDALQEALKQQLDKMFDSDFIIKVAFRDIVFQ
ncbi:flagellar basal body-associated FliL family protein [Lachnotalea glycerini]|jgi:flagellar basal body-associated protein FliL|uniref:Flagellar protein FliL n=1 Tax=Lachnotalea glycerini TaxID=1763509 RepID=A0A371JID1_9FIRM|nr:flagellar basal body-associated FliL family protein [Lachnotalea glycerini]RDY32476.1 flagellar basal body-associated protein FliL [Lachnotalea glycerini]